jgi:hypothetical protein
MLGKTICSQMQSASCPSCGGGAGGGAGVGWTWAKELPKLILLTLEPLTAIISAGFAVVCVQPG